VINEKQQQTIQTEIKSNCVPQKHIPWTLPSILAHKSKVKIANVIKI